MSLELVDLLGSLGNITRITIFFTQSTIIIDLCRTKDTSKITWLLFIFTILSCEFWMIYGIKLKDWAIIICNILGISTNSIYITTFVFFLEEEKMWKRIFYIFTLFLFFILTSIFSFVFIEDIQIIGAIAMIINIFLYASPLQKIFELFKYKDNSYLNIWIAISLTANSITWLLYSYFTKDIFIMIPNIIGLILNLIQIHLWFKFRKDTVDLNNNNLKFSEKANQGSDEYDELNQLVGKESNNHEGKLEEKNFIKN